MSQQDILITENIINAGEIISKVIVPESGGIDVFIGTVRNKTKGKFVERLEYEAYKPMAEKEINKIVDEVKEKWTPFKIAIYHRVGSLYVGEIAVVIAVSTAHRAEAFESCRYIIEELKKRVPIWKKEVFQDGEEWVSAHP